MQEGLDGDSVLVGQQRDEPRLAPYDGCQARLTPRVKS
jgi:hypothetical protein